MQERDYNWTDIAEDLLPFLARNQFKDSISKYYEDANKDKSLSKQEKDFAQRLESMMNPDKEILKDTVKIIAHIDGANSGTTFMRLKRTNMYTKANLEGQKLLLKQ